MTDAQIMAAFRRGGEWIPLTVADIERRTKARPGAGQMALARAINSLAQRGFIAADRRHNVSIFDVTDAGRARFGQ